MLFEEMILQRLEFGFQIVVNSPYFKSSPSSVRISHSIASLLSWGSTPPLLSSFSIPRIDCLSLVCICEGIRLRGADERHGGKSRRGQTLSLQRQGPIFSSSSSSYSPLLFSPPLPLCFSSFTSCFASSESSSLFFVLVPPVFFFFLFSSSSSHLSASAF